MPEGAAVSSRHRVAAQKRFVTQNFAQGFEVVHSQLIDLIGLESAMTDRPTLLTIPAWLHIANNHTHETWNWKCPERKELVIPMFDVAIPKIRINRVLIQHPHRSVGGTFLHLILKYVFLLEVFPQMRDDNILIEDFYSIQFYEGNLTAALRELCAFVTLVLDLLQAQPRFKLECEGRNARNAFDSIELIQINDVFFPILFQEFLAFS